MTKYKLSRVLRLSDSSFSSTSKTSPLLPHKFTELSLPVYPLPKAYQSNMKFISATAISLLAAVASAGVIDARAPQATFALSNDQTGAYSSAVVVADGTPKKISALFKGTSVAAGGNVLASSGQLTAFPQSIKCVLTRNGAPVATLTAWTTYIDLDGNPQTSIPQNLNNAAIKCTA